MTGPEFATAAHLGFRNLSRNPRRSLITGLGIAVALLVLIILTGLLAGLREQLLRNGTELILGHIQIHHAEYLPDRHVADTIATDDLGALLAQLARHEEIIAVAPRVRAYGLVSSGDASAGAQLLGVDPAGEGELSTLLDHVDGAAPDPSAGSFGIVLGAGLAREINAGIGSELAVVAQSADGSLGNALFSVTGLLRTGSRALDRTLAIAHLADYQQLLALADDDVHELALLTRDPVTADATASTLAAAGPLPAAAQARSWGQLAPQLRDYIDVNQGAGRFLTLLVALFAAFGVMNSMLMAVYERTREFGTLSALGTRPGLILSTLLAEAMLLALAGLAAGLVAGMLVMWHMASRGWDLSRWTGELTVMETRLDPVLRGVWVWDEIGAAAVGLTLAALIAVLIASWRVLRIDPIAAMAAPTEG